MFFLKISGGDADGFLLSISSMFHLTSFFVLPTFIIYAFPLALPSGSQEISDWLPVLDSPQMILVSGRCN